MDGSTEREAPVLDAAGLKDFLDHKAAQYEHPSFLDSDPIQVPHAFERKEDIEISAFLTATIAWGNRKTIIKSADRMMAFMDHSPYDFVLGHDPRDLRTLGTFVHRTFNGEDLTYFVTALRELYEKYGGLEAQFVPDGQNDTLDSLAAFKARFFSFEGAPERSRKHLGDPSTGSAAKRLNMFLRWMVRSDASGVDFGLWKDIDPAALSCPLDVHSGNVARKLGLLDRKQNDAVAVRELDAALRELDPKDPVRYDFALFGLGVFEGF